MKNEIIKIHSNEAERIRTALVNDQDMHLVVLDGSLYQTWDDYVNAMALAFKFPKEPHYNGNAYLDWMTDLDWLNKEKFALMITNYNVFMKEDLELKKKIHRHFKEIILPFWEEEVIHTVVDGYPKSFNVYLVD